MCCKNNSSRKSVIFSQIPELQVRQTGWVRPSHSRNCPGSQITAVYLILLAFRQKEGRHGLKTYYLKVNFHVKMPEIKFHLRN